MSHKKHDRFTWLGCLLAAGCASSPAPAVPPEKGDLLIEELYYSGAAPGAGADHYFSDQFIELVNTTDHPLDLSGVMIGDAYGVAGAINPGTSPDSYADARPNEVVLSSVWRLPEGIELERGGHLLIAHDGVNHRPFSTVDLSGAAFETYVEGSMRDDDYQTVPNLEEVAFNGGSDWLITVFGPSVVILEAGTTLGSVSGSLWDLSSAPADRVLDAVEALMDEEAAEFKRLPSGVDAGFAFVSGTYVGESLQRVQVDGVFQDTDDSSTDFATGTPDPHRVENRQGIVGEPSIELGTGLSTFEPLTDGDPIILVEGLQGGWHIDASVRLDGLRPHGLLLVYDAVDTSGNRLSFETQALLQERALIADGEGWARIGDRVVFDIGDAEEIIDTTIVLRVAAQLDGQTWSDQRQLTVMAPSE